MRYAKWATVSLMTLGTVRRWMGRGKGKVQHGEWEVVQTSAKVSKLSRLKLMYTSIRLEATSDGWMQFQMDAV